jgi:hypothetical protein
MRRTLAAWIFVMSSLEATPPASPVAVPAVDPSNREPEKFTAFDATIEESFALARLSGAPVLVQTSSRRDGAITCKEQ